MLEIARGSGIDALILQWDALFSFRILKCPVLTWCATNNIKFLWSCFLSWFRNNKSIPPYNNCFFIWMTRHVTPKWRFDLAHPQNVFYQEDNLISFLSRKQIFTSSKTHNSCLCCSGKTGVHRLIQNNAMAPNILHKSAASFSVNKSKVCQEVPRARKAV